MATIAHPVDLEQASAHQTPEQALCAMFDLFEDVLEKMSPEKRKAWLAGLSETVENPEKQL
jgi:hypothetical protein